MPKMGNTNEKERNDVAVTIYVEQGLIPSCGQVDAVLPMLFVASYSYNKTGANTHATVIKLSFGRFLYILWFKKWPNDNLITVACVFALVSL